MELKNYGEIIKKYRTIRLFQSGAVVQRWQEEICTLCNVENDLEHMLLSCDKYDDLRQKYGIGENDIEDTDILNILQLDERNSNDNSVNFLVEMYDRKINLLT